MGSKVVPEWSCSSDTISSGTSQLRPLNVISDSRFSKKAEGQRYNNLEPNNQHNTSNQLDSAMVHLNRTQESWNKQQHSRFHTETQGQEETGHHWLALDQEVDSEEQVQHHDLVVEHR
jgi:hypothetical protein